MELTGRRMFTRLTMKSKGAGSSEDMTFSCSILSAVLRETEIGCEDIPLLLLL